MEGSRFSRLVIARFATVDDAPKVTFLKLTHWDPSQIVGIAPTDIVEFFYESRGFYARLRQLKKADAEQCIRCALIAPNVTRCCPESNLIGILEEPLKVDRLIF